MAALMTLLRGSVELGMATFDANWNHRQAAGLDTEKSRFFFLTGETRPCYPLLLVFGNLFEMKWSACGSVQS
jgi:hypothetical protein